MKNALKFYHSTVFILTLNYPKNLSNTRGSQYIINTHIFQLNINPK
jgi:hypothetical protein